jgi:glycosyltransferase involved in cell wall biosynthesis
MVRPGITGLLASPRDVAELRHSITELLRVPEKLAEMAANCRRIALTEYGLQRQIERYAQVYESALQRRTSERQVLTAHCTVKSALS